MDKFTKEVIGQNDIIESFKQFKTEYQKEQDISISDNFSISDSAVKKGSKTLKSIIKLDKNFDIFIHGNRDLIEQGANEKGKYYKVYYKEES